MNRMTRFAVAFTAALLCAGAAVAADAAPAPPAPAPAAPAGPAAAPNPFVGTDRCMVCHIDFAKTWAKVKHSQALLKSGRAPEKTGCEACHGPGGLHTTTSRHTIVAWDKLTSEQANAVCLKCHAERGLSQELWDATAHSQVLTCPDCHEVHRPQKRDFMLRREEGKDCSPCHDDLADKIKAKEHHTLADGALSCGQCHALHGGKESHLLKKPQGELCVTCHDQDVPRPDTHKAKTWRLKHKAEAKGHEPQCYMCHDQESFCNQCHSVKIPHPDNWAEKLHAPEAKAKPGPCLKCHEVAYCQACHDPLPPEIDKLVKDKAAK